MKTENPTITISTNIKKELEFLFTSLSQENNNQFDSLEDLINYVLWRIADGSRRPGAWERGMLEMMNMVPDNEIFHNYREQYGDPNVD